MTLGNRSIAALALALATPSGAALAADSSTGGADYTPVPVISSVKCASQCSGETRVRAGGTVRVAGRNLRDVRSVVFHGSKSTKSDNIRIRVTSTDTRSFRVKVPLSAASGPLTAWKSSTVGSD